MGDESQSRLPRGALIVVAVGLLATVAAALLANPNASAGAVEIEWEQQARLADSKPAPLPGGGGAIQLVEGGLKASGRNASGYQLVRAADVLAVSKGAAVGGARVRCAIRVPSRHTLVGHSPNGRSAYPRPTEDEELLKQPVPENVLTEFNAEGTDIALVEFGDAFPKFANERGVTASWITYRPGRQEWQWGLPSGRTVRRLELGFAAIWRTTVKPSAQVSCSLATSAGPARVSTAGAISGSPQQIAE